MADKSIQSPPGRVSLELDDLKQIQGIGPGIERRFHDAGIFTYSQLAALTMDEMTPLFTDLTGFTPQRLAQKDWIGQAARLAAEVEKTLVIEENAERQHYALFSIELLMDEANTVRRTRVINGQNHSEGVWAGWDEVRLAEFIRKGNEKQPSPKQATAESEQSTAQTETVHAKVSLPSGVKNGGQVELGEVKMLFSNGQNSQEFLHHKQPFQIAVDLDLSQVSLPPKSLLDYSVVVYARKLGSSPAIIAGNANGKIQMESHARLLVEGTALQRGNYRIDVLVTLSPGGVGVNSKNSLRALKEGGILQVL